MTEYIITYSDYCRLDRVQNVSLLKTILWSKITICGWSFLDNKAPCIYQPTFYTYVYIYIYLSSWDKTWIDFVYVTSSTLIPMDPT